MGYAPGRLGEVKFKQETTANEAIANAATWAAASPKQLKVHDVSNSLKYLSEDDPSLQTHVMADPKRLLLNKGGTLGFRTFLFGLSAAASNGVQVVQDALGLALKCALGGEALGTSTTVDGANTGTGGAGDQLKVTSAAGIGVGTAIRVGTEMRRVTAKSSNDLTLDMKLSSAPTSGTVAASATYFPLEAALVDPSNANRISLAALFRGYDSEDQWLARGCFAGVELAELGPKKLARLAWTLHPQDWDLVTGVAVGSAFTEPNPGAQINSGLYINAQGTETRNYRHTKSVDVKLGLTVSELPSPVGENGVAGHAVFGGRTALEYERYYDSEDNVGYEAGTLYLAGYQIGTSVLLTFPQLSFDDTPEPGGSPERTVKSKFHADNGPTTTSDTTLARFAIHRFGT